MTLAEKARTVDTVLQRCGHRAGRPQLDQNDLAARGGLGSVLNLTGAHACNDLQRQAVEKSRLKIPILFGLDVIHGSPHALPDPAGAVGRWDPALAEHTSRIAAVEAVRRGRPLDVLADGRHRPRRPLGPDRRRQRRGSLPGLGVRAAYVRGYQGTRPAATHLDRSPAPSISSATARPRAGGNTTLPIFPSARSATSICRRSMPQSTRAPGTLCRASTRSTACPPAPTFIADRHSPRRMGFPRLRGQRLDLHPRDHAARRRPGRRRTPRSRAFMAGVDMDMQSDLYAAELPGLVRSGRLKMEAVDRAVAARAADQICARSLRAALCGRKGRRDARARTVRGGVPGARPAARRKNRSCC